MATTFGSQQMTFTSATPVFPTNGKGGSQASVHPNFPAAAQYLIEAVTLGSGLPAAGTLTVFAGDGTTSLFTQPIITTMTGGQYIPLGGLNGVHSTAGISAQCTGGNTVTLWFRELFASAVAPAGNTG